LLGFTWLPDFDAGEFDVNFRAAPGSRVEYTTQKGQEVAALVRQVPEVDFTYMTVGGGGGFGRGSNSGTIYVRLADKRDRLRSQQEIQAAIRSQFPAITGIRPSIGGSRSIFGGMGQPIRIFVQGPEVSRLKLAAEQVMQAVREVPGVAEPTSSDEGEIPQLDVKGGSAAGLGGGARDQRDRVHAAAALPGPARDAVGGP
jgi:HAE1 family hydrophobic/amphiphilic exporter-1